MTEFERRQPDASRRRKGIPSPVESVLNAPGRELDPSVRAPMEERFSHDFSRIRIHADTDAARSADAIDAQAYTFAQHVVLGSGAYQPHTLAGWRLLAHELSHTVQQDDGATGVAPSIVSDPSSVPEHEAEAAAHAAEGGRVPGGSLTPGTSAGVVQRSPKDPAAAPPESSTYLDIEMDPLIRINGVPTIDPQVFINRCSEALAYVASEYDQGAAILKQYASRYGDAWDTCLKVLADAGRKEALFDEYILNSALAMIPGGVGGVVGGMLKNAGQKDFIVDGVKDLVKDLLRRGGREVLGRDPRPVYHPLGDNPRTWQNNVESNLMAEKAFVEGILQFYMNRVNVASSSFRLNFDPMAEIERFVRAQGQRMSSLPTATEKDALRFEKLMWKSWVEKNRYYLQELRSTAGVGYQIGDRVPSEVEPIGGVPGYLGGKPIRARIYAVAAGLGEDGDAWLEQWSVDSLRALKAERDRRNVDAPGSSIKRFLEWLLD